MKFPKTIKVGYKIYDINVDPEKHEEYEQDIDRVLLGLTAPDEFYMSFKVGANEELLRETVLHELLHACVDMTHLIMDDEDEERIVGAISKSLFTVFKENKGLVDLVWSTTS